MIEHIDWNQLGGAATATGFVLAGLRKLWMAIKRRLDRLEVTRTAQIEGIKAHSEAGLAAHETKDMQRHTENLAVQDEFRKELIYIGKALAGLGWRNGRGDDVPPHGR